MNTIDCRADIQQAITEAGAVVRRGELIVLPTDTVYGIGADPMSARAVDRLLTAKGRGRDKPSPVLVGSPAAVERLASTIPDTARALIERFWPGALTIVLPAQPEIGWDLGETHGTVALRMPNDPFTIDLLNEVGPLAVSSANLTTHEPALTVADAQRQLGEKVSLYLDGGVSAGGQPSTIVVLGETVRVVREGALPASEVLSVAAAAAPGNR